MNFAGQIRAYTVATDKAIATIMYAFRNGIQSKCIELPNIIRTYAKERAVGAIHELPLRQNEAFRAFLRKS